MNISTFARQAIRQASARYADARTWGAQADSYESLRDMVAVALSLEDEYGTPDAVLAAIDAVTAHELEEGGF
jgi:hypothetical protein